MPLLPVMVAISPLTLPPYPGSCQYLENDQDGIHRYPRLEEGGRLWQVYEGFSRMRPLGFAVGREIPNSVVGG